MNPGPQGRVFGQRRQNPARAPPPRAHDHQMRRLLAPFDHQPPPHLDQQFVVLARLDGRNRDEIAVPGRRLIGRPRRGKGPRQRQRPHAGRYAPPFRRMHRRKHALAGVFGGEDQAIGMALRRADHPRVMRNRAGIHQMRIFERNRVMQHDRAGDIRAPFEPEMELRHRQTDLPDIDIDRPLGNHIPGSVAEGKAGRSQFGEYPADLVRGGKARPQRWRDAGGAALEAGAQRHQVALRRGLGLFGPQPFKVIQAPAHHGGIIGPHAPWRGQNAEVGRCRIGEEMPRQRQIDTVDPPRGLAQRTQKQSCQIIGKDARHRFVLSHCIGPAIVMQIRPCAGIQTLTTSSRANSSVQGR